jgi:hypothetical protein
MIVFSLSLSLLGRDIEQAGVYGMKYYAVDVCMKPHVATGTLSYVCNNPPVIIANDQTVNVRLGAEVRNGPWK